MTRRPTPEEAAQIRADLVELRRIHVEEDVTQEALAAAVGIPRVTLSSLVNDPDKTPLPRTRHKVRAFLERRRAAHQGEFPQAVNS